LFTKSRLSTIPEKDLTSHQRKVLSDIVQGRRGSLDGPFLAWIHSPHLADYAQQLGAFCRYGTRLETRLSELAILTTAALWRSQAEWMIHEPIGLESGLSKQILESLKVGETPDFAKDDEALIYKFATTLYDTNRIDDVLYAQAVEMWGEGGVVELTGLMGYYAMVAMTLNVFGVLPDDSGKVLPFCD
jgi:4-carboxymuconolactone decarboxylase